MSVQVIVIRRADKGSGVVVIDTAEYLKRLQGEVDDPTTYRLQERDQTKIINEKVQNLALRPLKGGYIDKHLHMYRELQLLLYTFVFQRIFPL